MIVEQRNVVTINYFVVTFHEVELPKKNVVSRVIVISYVKSFVPWGTFFYRFVKESSFESYNIAYYTFCWNKLSSKFSQSSGWNKDLLRNKRNCIQNVINARLGDFQCSWWKVYIYPYPGKNFAWFLCRFLNFGHKTYAKVSITNSDLGFASS